MSDDVAIYGYLAIFGLTGLAFLVRLRGVRDAHEALRRFFVLTTIALIAAAAWIVMTYSPLSGVMLLAFTALWHFVVRRIVLWSVGKLSPHRKRS